ncbi:M15 family metallopeptidase [Streptomyces aidingensis]|uniref:D-alanyl-D-alanine carboxypeptidase n=1 Tax=Streptomyces aidingensis TaxID=910347 RepID=A0A1I1DYY4_9ACTN|nr:M15 family metallopeptidase [Streptomyces aidingensis]SFB80034.1 D-alanyl-D-alanine carboxypeptidase [Streptomyces aidingensis]
MRKSRHLPSVLVPAVPAASLLALVLLSLLTAAACSGSGSGADSGEPSAPSGTAPSSGPPAAGAPATPSAPAEPTGEATDGTATPSTEPAEPAGADPVITELSDEQWDEMVADGVWRAEDCPLTRADLRRVEVNHIDFNGEVARGVLVVNADVAESVARIFTRLYEERFPIRRMQPVEAYDGDTNASLADDNTSAYNCRRPDQINAPAMESPHANGRAIDINPLENPWMDLRCDCWFPSAEHHERTEGKGKILDGGPVWQAFTDEGWIWQNIDVPDYMHFDTGYPSRPFTSRQN